MVYKSQWDALFVENNTTFRSKVKVKFNPQTRKSPLPSDNKDIAKLTFVSPKSLASRIDCTWKANSKQIKITKQSKSWWNEECNNALNTYQSSRSREYWKGFKNKVKATKQSFFDNQIQEIINKRRGPWELMNWVNKKKLLAIKTIKYNDQ